MWPWPGEEPRLEFVKIPTHVWPLTLKKFNKSEAKTEQRDQTEETNLESLKLNYSQQLADSGKNVDNVRILQ